jgi:hypothetical protein
MTEIVEGATFQADNEEHRIVAISNTYVITAHGDGAERAWRREDLKARLGLIPIVPDAGIRLIETAGPYEPTLHVEGSGATVLGFGMYRTGRTIMISPDGTWVEEPA